MIAGRIDRAPGGEIRLRLGHEERLLIREVAETTRELLRDGDESDLRRLSPPAYEDDELAREYRELTQGQLTAGHERALDLLAATADRDLLSADEADAWVRALNVARLVLGTRLDVTEDVDWEVALADDPRAPELAIYAYVSWIQEQLVDVLG